MGDIQRTLGSVVSCISDKNYDQSLDSYRFWFGIAQTYSQNPPDQIPDALYNNIGTTKELVHPTAHLIIRFASDAESDHILGPHCIGLQSRLCARNLRDFFENTIIGSANRNYRGEVIEYPLPTYATFVAHWANLGYLKEATIRDHVLQSLISHSKLEDHQADALIVLFKLAGATFGEYANPSVVDRCFELLRSHSLPGSSERNRLVQLIELRERGWEGLPPPPVFATRKPKPTGMNQTDPAATPIVVSLGLPNTDPEPQVPQSPPPESAPAPEADTVPETTITRSPSISIASLSDLTIADTSDDESPIDPTVITPHDTFYLEDGNVEVLCGNTLFRVHTSILSFHSPALRRMFAQTNLATEDSPNGCPRILSSDTARDFATLLKMIYLPGFPEKNKAPDFATFSSLLRITAKYELPTVRSQLLEVVRDAYPETFEGLTPSKPLGESVFNGPTPHPNEVLNLFVQQKLTSLLPMAYYMATRRGAKSLMTRHTASAQLPPETLQAAIEGLIALREMELKETHRLIFESMASHPRSPSNCSSRTPAAAPMSDLHQKIIDQITGSTRSGTKVLQVLSLNDVCGGDDHGLCGNCVERWESGHAEVRRKAWATLPDVFGLKT